MTLLAYYHYTIILLFHSPFTKNQQLVVASIKSQRKVGTTCPTKSFRRALLPVTSHQSLITESWQHADEKLQNKENIDSINSYI
jgi:hypothetical protein